MKRPIPPPIDTEHLPKSPAFPSQAILNARRRSAQHRLASRVSFALIIMSACWANFLGPGHIPLFLFWTGICGFALSCAVE